ncbi:portal_PBSX, phage portal protein, PBSX family [uncultured Caudovirales phage]|uniref:Portal_PBSX, phage portal protein, PBSX family n=1 Tax=uncultured Caudovirales phage TaxID=2100421 RepID=A0A6J5SLT0_9CAUD|nr:portal_PBSX, phage portal protein, PBSX family [uncultured Caudovirales phage]
MKQNQNFSIVNVNNNQLPIINEDTKTRYNWIPFGVWGHDDFFDAVTTAWNVSTTNAACVEGIADLVFGKGLYSKNKTNNDLIQKLIPQEETKRVAFDLKLYGNAAYQVYWNDDHTQIKKMYHVPVQYLRAEKIYNNPKIQNYFYCTDWNDARKIKDKKKLAAFGTSNNNCEILWIKNYTPGLYYYSLPDWIAAMQFCISEGEISNLHFNNITNGFLPAVMINFNNGIPAPEERETIEDLVQAKFTGTDNAGRFMLSFNDDVTNKPTIDVIDISNLHEKYEYVADYTQDRILVAHRVTSPLLFGIRTANNGFSSQSEEMKTAFSIMQTMTISPFQNLILNTLDMALTEGGYEDMELYFEQLTPLVILAQTADETGKSIGQVEDETNKSMENPATQDNPGDQTNVDDAPQTKPAPAKPGQTVNETISMSSPNFKKEYEITKQ